MLSNWARGTIDGRNPVIISSYGKSICIYRVSYVSGGAEFSAINRMGNFSVTCFSVSKNYVSTFCHENLHLYLSEIKKTCLARSAVFLEKTWVLTNIKEGSTHTHMLHECHMYLHLP